MARSGGPQVWRRRPLPPAFEPGSGAPGTTVPAGSGEYPRRVRAVFRSNPALVAGLALLVGFAVAAIIAIARFGPHLTALTLDPSLEIAPSPPGPSLAHPFGVMMRLGVDESAALLQATPWDVALIGGAVAGAAVLGGGIGAWDGLRSGAGRGSTRWIADTVTSVPAFFLALAVMFNAELVLPPTLWVAALAGTLAVVLAAQHVRAVAAAARTAATSPYAEAARSFGARSSRLLFRHVWPNALRPSLAQVPVDVFNVVFLLTAFPFIGCVTAQSVVGFAYPNPLPGYAFPEWGFLLATGVCYGFSAVDPVQNWWMWFFPAALLVAFGATVTLLSDGILAYLRRGYR